MANFVVKATLTVDVEISIKAKNKDEAKKIFNENIAVNATLLDIPAEVFSVNEDCISDHTIENVEKE